MSTLAPTSATAPELRNFAVTLAAGNPLLLKQLDQLLKVTKHPEPEVPAALEAKTDRFRKKLQLAHLLGMLPPEAQRLLARLWVYTVPVEREAVEAVAGEVPVEPHLARAAVLGLVEEGKTLEGAARYAVAGVVRPLLEDKLPAEEKQEAARQATRFLYRSFWKRDAGYDIHWGPAIHQLSLIAEEREIASEVGATLAATWIGVARFQDAITICEATLQAGGDYRALHQLARAKETLGHTAEAREHYIEALAGCALGGSSASNLEERAAILNNMAGLAKLQGDISRALQLWKEASRSRRRSVI